MAYLPKISPIESRISPLAKLIKLPWFIGPSATNPRSKIVVLSRNGVGGTVRTAPDRLVDRRFGCSLQRLLARVFPFVPNGRGPVRMDFLQPFTSFS